MPNTTHNNAAMGISYLYCKGAFSSGFTKTSPSWLLYFRRDPPHIKEFKNPETSKLQNNLNYLVLDKKSHPIIEILIIEHFNYSQIYMYIEEESGLTIRKASI